MGKLRPYAAPLIDKLSRPLSKLSPNLLTLSSVPFAILFTILMWKGQRLEAIPFLLLSVAFDAIDGAVARMTGRTSKAGAFLDSAVDRLNDVIIFMSLPTLGVPWTVTYFWITGSILVPLIRAVAESEGKELGGKGIMERGDRIAALLILILIHWLELKFYPASELRYVPALAAGVAALIWLTVLQRLYYTNSTKAFWVGFNASAIVLVLFVYGWWDPLGVVGVSGGLSCAYLVMRFISLGGKFPASKADALVDAGMLLSFIFLRGLPSWAFFFFRVFYYFRELRGSRT